MADEGDSSFLGPSYEYWKNIKQPGQMGMSPAFTLDALSADVTGLLSYVEVLVTGSGNASKTGKPLGNKFFLKTNGKCRELTIEKWKKEQDEDKQWDIDYNKVDVDLKNKTISEDEATKKKNELSALKKKREEDRTKKDNKIVDRWIYVNNIPDGRIPFISSGSDGSSFSDLRGLIPGAMGNLSALNPAPLFKAFVTGSTPDCAEITLETVDQSNTKRTEKRHLALMDVADMNPCYFGGGLNPASGNTCQGFTNNAKSKTETSEDNEPVLVSENGDTIGLYEMGSLAGSSGVAYQTTHRSPLSYNIANNKATTMSGLEYSKFGVQNENKNLSSDNIIDKHNSVTSSFFKNKIGDGADIPTNEHNTSDEMSNESMLSTLSNLINSLTGSETKTDGTDLSKIEGGIPVQVYYASISFLLLYFIYKMNYTMR
jgi:hypothetical protein